LKSRPDHRKTQGQKQRANDCSEQVRQLSGENTTRAKTNAIRTLTLPRNATSTSAPMETGAEAPV
jgi:hypothetical protein